MSPAKAHPTPISPRQIELSIQQGNTLQAKLLISNWFNSITPTFGTRLQASEYYRRIAETSLAIRALGIERVFHSYDRIDQNQGAFQLQLARLINAWGGSKSALELLESVPPSIKSKWPAAVGGIALSNYRYPLALKAYLQLTKAEPKNYFAKILLSRALQGLGQFKESNELLDELISEFRRSKESVGAVALQTLASNFLLQGNYRHARAPLQEMIELRALMGNSVDQGNGYKWEAAYWCLKGENTKAQAAIKKAWRLLFIRGEKPELWTELLYWEGYLRWRQHPKTLPNAWIYLLTYPSPGCRAQQWIMKNWPLEIPNQILAGKGKDTWDAQSWDFSRPELVVGYLQIAGEHGIPQLRLAETLWPNEPRNVFLWEKRLEFQLHQVRRELKVPIMSEHRHLQLMSGHPKRRVLCLPFQSKILSPRRLAFLAQHPQFSVGDICQEFRVSSRSAARIKAKWKSN